MYYYCSRASVRICILTITYAGRRITNVNSYCCISATCLGDDGDINVGISTYLRQRVGIEDLSVYWQWIYCIEMKAV